MSSSDCKLFLRSDRAALCKLWRSIVLRDEAAMEKHSNTLGVKGDSRFDFSATGYAKHTRTTRKRVSIEY